MQSEIKVRYLRPATLVSQYGSTALAYPSVANSVVTVPLEDGASLKFVSMAADKVKIYRTQEAPCRAKTMTLTIGASAGGAVISSVFRDLGSNIPLAQDRFEFGFVISRLVPPDRRDDILALNTLNQSWKYSAKELLTGLSSTTMPTSGAIAVDIAAWFASNQDIRGVEDYTISIGGATAATTTAVTIIITCNTTLGLCFDFDIFGLRTNGGNLVKATTEEFADDILTTQYLQQKNDHLLFANGFGDPISPAYPRTGGNKMAYYRITGLQLCTVDDQAAFSRHENSGTPGYIELNVPYSLNLMVESDANEAAWYDALLTAFAVGAANVATSTVYPGSPCNLASATTDAWYAACPAPSAAGGTIAAMTITMANGYSLARVTRAFMRNNTTGEEIPIVLSSYTSTTPTATFTANTATGRFPSTTACTVYLQLEVYVTASALKTGCFVTVKKAVTLAA